MRHHPLRNYETERDEGMNRRARYFLIVLSLCFFLGFYFFSKAADSARMADIDFAASIKIQEKIDHSSRLRLAAFVGNILEGAVFFASPTISVVLILVCFFVSLYHWKKKKIHWWAWGILACFALLIAGEIYGKQAVHHPAPPFFMIKHPTTIFPKYHVVNDFSYPSGHTARAVFISLVAYALLTIQYPVFKTVRYRAGYGFALVGYVLLVATSSIYLGHHWLSDILGGVLLGGGFGLLTAAIISPIIEKHE
jgi:membrane-associated phospholipid phosphatase